MSNKMPRTIIKPWGYEDIWAETDTYVGKLLCINPHNRLSLQYHRVKEETIRVIRGTLLLHCPKPGADPLDPDCLEVRELNPNEVYHVSPRTLHRFEAGDSLVELIEVSTPFLDDVVRVSDDWNRGSDEPDKTPKTPNHQVGRARGGWL